MSAGRLLAVPLPLWIGFFLLADLALAWPQLDLIGVGFFYEPAQGFAARGQWWEQFAYHSIGYLLWLVSLGMIGCWLWRRQRAVRDLTVGVCRGARDLPAPDGRRLALLLTLLVLVPGLLVNAILKEHWGRPRPVQVQEFGGSRPMVAAFVPSRWGGGSFSSGHAAAAAWLVAVAVLLRGRRSPWVLVALAYAGLVGLARVAAGGHFPSDVLISFLLVWIGYLMLHRWFLGPLRDPPPD